MDKTKKMNLSTPVLFASFAGGLVLYLAPQDGRATFFSPWRELFVVLMAVLVAVLLLIVSRRYESVGVALIVMIGLVLINYISHSIALYWRDKELGQTFLLHMDFYDAFCWGLVWFIPFLICITVRVFASGGWDSEAHHGEFIRFFKMAVRSFYVYYALVFLACFVFVNPVDLWGKRAVNLTPFYGFFDSFSKPGASSLSFFSNLLFFVPLGYFATVRMRRMRWFLAVLIGLAVGILVEGLQFAFNTGVADINDAILNMIGFVLGFAAKLLLDGFRAFVTNGEETRIQYL